MESDTDTHAETDTGELHAADAAGATSPVDEVVFEDLRHHHHHHHLPTRRPPPPSARRSPSSSRPRACCPCSDRVLTPRNRPWWTSSSSWPARCRGRWRTPVGTPRSWPPTWWPRRSPPTRSSTVKIQDFDPEGSGASSATAHFPPLAKALVEGDRVSLDRHGGGARGARPDPDQSIARILTAQNLVTEADLMWGMAQEMGLEFVDLDTVGRRLRRGRLDPRGHRPAPQRDGHRQRATAFRWWPHRIPPTCSPWTTSAPSWVGASSSSWPPEPRSAPTSDGPSTVAAMPPTWPWRPRSEIDGSGPESGIDDIQAVTEEAPIVRYVNLLILQALNERASDIHVEPTGTDLRIRYRIDGVLHDVSTAPRAIAAGRHHPAEGHGRHERGRAPGPPGRAHLAQRGEQGHRPPDGHPADHPRREGRHAGARQVERRARASPTWASTRTCSRPTRASTPSRTGPSW